MLQALSTTRTLFPLLLVTLGACQSAEPKNPKALYDSVLKELSVSDRGGFEAETISKQEERFILVLRWLEEGRVSTAEDYLWCAGALVESDEFEHLQLAHELALQAAELGDKRGFTMEAYATDKLLVDAEAPYQRYGTVIIYSPVLERFELYPVDPTTTDTIRRSVGVPPLAELMKEVEELNETDLTERLRGEVISHDKGR